MSDVESYRLADGTAVVFSARCPGKEGPNEDGAVLIPVNADRAVVAVADGVGGAQAGEAAAEIALRALTKSVAAAANNDRPMRAAILDAIEEANREVQAHGVGAATTLAVAEIDGKTFRPYHVGDTMALLIGQRGKLKLQTVPHSPVGFGVEAGLLDEDEAMHHEDRHIVSNVVGSPEMRVEVGPAIQLAARDTLLLATDGLMDNLTVGEIVERLRAGSLDLSAADLACDARTRMTEPMPGRPSKPDDLTFVTFRLTAR
jgi:serine/threonine protein phosphatase PrpC